MRVLTADQFEVLLKDSTMKPRFKRDLKFRSSTERLDDEQWVQTELLPIWNKSKNGGVLLIEWSDDLYMIAFDASKSDADASGRSRSVICDLCYTWQGGRNGGFVTFYPKSEAHSMAFLCCMDLRCSDHVRTKTPASLKSRAQLRENMTNDDRVLRLRQKLELLVERLQIVPIS